MAKYKVKHTNIMHNDTLYKEGSIIELSEDDAKRLEDFVDFVSETKKAETTTKTNSNKTASNKQNKTSTKAKTEVKAETKTETSVPVVEGTDGGNADGK